MNFKKNKTAIIAIVVLLVVCAGTFFGVRAMNKNLDNTTTGEVSISETSATTTEVTTSINNSTTAAPANNSNDTLVPTTLPMATTNSLAQISQSTTADSEIITTYPMVPSNSSTTKPTTTKDQTNAVVTTKPTTTKATNAVTQPATSVTQSVTQSTTAGENGAAFDEGLAGYLYNPDGNYYYTNSDPWQRALGYNEFYDLGAGFVGIYMDTIRFKFEYANKDWMIQFWKGQYGYLFVGHEIGVYTKPKDREVEHYDAATENDENALLMSMTGYRDGQEIYSREYAKYWWCTGFVPGKLDNFSDRSELSLKCRITMKDQTMLEAFTKSLQQSGLVPDKDYTVSGLDVFITW